MRDARRQRELDRLLAQGALSGPEKDRILERVLAQRVRVQPSLFSWQRLSWAVSVALLLLVVPSIWLLRREDGGLRPKGPAVVGPLLEVSCHGPCVAGAVLFFRVERSVQRGYLAAFATSSSGKRIWYFPTVAGAMPELPIAASPVVLRKGVRIGSEHAPGTYQVHLLMTRHRLTRERIAVLADGRSEEIVAHRVQTIEVR